MTLESARRERGPAAERKRTIGALTSATEAKAERIERSRLSNGFNTGGVIV